MDGFSFEYNEKYSSLYNNKIGPEGGVAVGNGLKENNSLQRLE